MNYGILDCQSQKEANNYFDLLDMEIQSIPTQASNISKLLELSSQYREATIENLKNR